MKKIMLIFGTRPEAIKMCPLIKELKRRDNVKVIVCVTGQHKEMLQSVLDIFEVVPDYNLYIMRQGQDLFDISIHILEKLRDILKEAAPDLVLVHGDTTTTFISALACYYQQIPVGHVEAGLRTYDVYSPYPEEFNRQAVSILAKYHFAPTQIARCNLLKEGKKEEDIYVTGNTAIDALKTTIRDDYSHKLLNWAADSRLILVTAHRRENLGENFKNMFCAIARIAEDVDDVKVIYPVHLNPVVRESAERYLGKCDKICLTEPLEVIDFHNVMKHACLILTDSGGIQEEAPALGIPVLVMRDTTERPEGIQSGTLKLVGTEENMIYDGAMSLLSDEKAYQMMSKAVNPYGDGEASKRIADILCAG